MITENGQEGNPFSFYYLDICCRLIEMRSNSRPVKEWTNADYLRLSEGLLQKTGVAISPNTLKRIFGKLKTSSRYYPQKATRDALATYVGYKDWEDFTSAQPPEEKTPLTIPLPAVEAGQKQVAPDPPERAVIRDLPRQSEPTIEPVPSSVRPVSAWKKSLLFTIAVLTALAIIILYAKNRSKGGSQLDKVQLISRATEANNPPHSTMFQLQIPKQWDKPADRFTLSYGDNRHDKNISPGELITHYYEAPGRYYAVLRYDGMPIDTVVVYIRSGPGWMATANMPADTTRAYPIDDLIFTKAGTLSVNTNTLQRSGIDTGHTFFVNFANVRPFSVSADNFQLTASVKTSLKRPGVRCSQVNVMVFGDRTMHSFAIMNKGCEAFSSAQFADWYANGASTDLSALAADLTMGGELMFQVKNKRVMISLNGQQLFQQTYRSSAGNIYGVNIMFSGIGEIYRVRLRDLRTADTIQLLRTSTSQ
jgi:hypothetical protein